MGKEYKAVINLIAIKGMEKIDTSDLYLVMYEYLLKNEVIDSYEDFLNYWGMFYNLCNWINLTRYGQ